MKKEMTREQLKELFRDFLKEGGVDWKELIEQQLKPIKESLEAQTTNWLARITSGLGKGERQEKEEKTLIVGRIIRALANAKGDTGRAIEWAKKNWGNDDPVIKAMSAGDASAGGFLVGPEFSTEVIELLRPMSVVRRMNPTMMPLDRGTLSIPKLTGGSTGTYIGENQNIVSTQVQTGMLEMTSKKLAAIVPISNDLLRFASVSADRVVRDDLISALNQRSDLAFIRGDGLSNVPKGLRNIATAANKILVNATVNLANITVDLGKLVLALMNANVRMLRPGWLFAPRTWHFLMTIRDGNGNFAFREEMLRGTLWGWPFAFTTQIPINLAVTMTNESEVYFVDFADAVIAEASEIEIDASPNAAYFDGSSVVAAFSQDQTVIRAIMRHDFGMRHDESVAVLIDVDWQ